MFPSDVDASETEVVSVVVQQPAAWFRADKTKGDSEDWSPWQLISGCFVYRGVTQTNPNHSAVSLGSGR